MQPELERFVEAEIWRVLRSQVPQAAMLVAAAIEEDVYNFRKCLCFRLSDGRDFHADLPSQFMHIGMGDARLFSRECVRLYSQLYEDYLLELRLRAAAENVRQLERLGVDPALVAQALRAHELVERHLRQHHRVRRDHPLMPVEPYTSAAEPTTGNTLTLEHLRDAMALTMRIPPERLQGRCAGADYTYAGPLGLDWARDASGDPKAQARALALFKDRLSPAQRAQYEAKQHFEVVGGDTGKHYRIRHGRQMNIDELDRSGYVVCGWCFLPQGGLAAGDVMLAQKIALECDERAALKVANRFETRGRMPGVSCGTSPGAVRLPSAGELVATRDRIVADSAAWTGA